MENLKSKYTLELSKLISDFLVHHNLTIEDIKDIRENLDLDSLLSNYLDYNKFNVDHIRNDDLKLLQIIKYRSGSVSPVELYSLAFLMNAIGFRFQCLFGYYYACVRSKELDESIIRLTASVYQGKNVLTMKDSEIRLNYATPLEDYQFTDQQKHILSLSRDTLRFLSTMYYIHTHEIRGDSLKIMVDSILDLKGKGSPCLDEAWELYRKYFENEH